MAYNSVAKLLFTRNVLQGLHFAGKTSSKTWNHSRCFCACNGLTPTFSSIFCFSLKINLTNLPDKAFLPIFLKDENGFLAAKATLLAIVLEKASSSE
jgi:hypothetical protein